jgi:hypothetical protein
MKMRGLVLGLLLALVAGYFIFFTKVAKDEKGGLEIMVDQYLESKIDLTRVNLENLAREIQSYAAETEGDLPETLAALQRLHPTAAAAADAWGRKIRYERLSDSSFRLRSAGPDGAFETGDDIVKDF